MMVDVSAWIYGYGYGYVMDDQDSMLYLSYKLDEVRDQQQ